MGLHAHARQAMKNLGLNSAVGQIQLFEAPNYLRNYSLVVKMVAEGRLRDRGDEEEFNTSFSFDVGASASSYEAQNPWEFAGESHSSCRAAASDSSPCQQEH